MPENFETKDKNEKYPDNAREKDPLSPPEHSIETSFTITPLGESEIHAKAQNGDILKVEFIQPGEFTAKQIENINAGEQDAINQINDWPLEDKAQKATEVINKTAKTGADVLNVASAFEDYSHRILKVDPASIKNPNIPLAGNHYLITVADSETIKAQLNKIGYNIEELNQIGFRAYKDDREIIMLHAAEKIQDGK